MDEAHRCPNLYAALAKAQRAIRGALKDTENPFFRSRYADLASVVEASRDALTANELCVIQLPATHFDGEPVPYTWVAKSGEERGGVRVPTRVSVTTRLAHSSGEYVDDTVSAMLPNGDPQAVGSAITYLRRYGYAAVAGVVAEDDDGEATTRPLPPHVDRATGEVREPAVLTLASPIPFGKHKAGGEEPKTVEEAGRHYFEAVIGRADKEGKGQDAPWYRFSKDALRLLADEDERDHEGEGEAEAPAPPMPGKPRRESPPATVAEQVARLRELLARPEVPAKTREMYGVLLDGLGEKATAEDVERIRLAVTKAAKVG